MSTHDTTSAEPVTLAVADTEYGPVFAVATDLCQHVVMLADVYGALAAYGREETEHA